MYHITSYMLLLFMLIVFPHCKAQQETTPSAENRNLLDNSDNSDNVSGSDDTLSNSNQNLGSVTCDKSTLSNSSCAGTPTPCGQYGVCAVCYPTCNGEVYGTCTLTDIPSYQPKEQACNDNLDNDCDNKADCEDSDCNSVPSCSCGDGVCASESETCENCPKDCGECATCGDGGCTSPSNCGDNTCSTDETCENCPKDCGECADCSACGCNCGTCDLGCCPEDIIKDFEDVPKTHQYYYQIKSIKRFKISVGCKSTPFLYCPDNALKRGEAAVFVARGLCFGPPWKTNPAPFTDVPVGHDWIGEIWALKDKGITAGKPDGTFGVEESINREDFVIFLAKSLNIQPDTSGNHLFSDVIDTNAYYYGYVQAYAKAEKIPGCIPSSGSCGKFFKGPGKLIHRGEASDWLVRAYNLKTDDTPVNAP